MIHYKHCYNPFYIQRRNGYRNVYKRTMAGIGGPDSQVRRDGHITAKRHLDLVKMPLYILYK